MAALASKRKRESSDMPAPRAAPGIGSQDFDSSYLNTAGDAMDHTDSHMDFAAALAQANADISEATGHHHDQSHLTGQQHAHNNGGQSASDTAAAAIAQYHTMTVPQSTESAFLAHAPETPGNDRPGSSSLDHGGPHGQQRTSNFSDFDIHDLKPSGGQSNGDDTSPTLGTSPNQLVPKPQVGTEEWNKVRRDNHKEVERRRRETINEGINELAKIVPGCEKNKGSILARAVQFITQLKENETQNIEKWTLEKLLTEQAIAELSSSCDKLKAECQRAWAECEQWKQAARKHGVSVELDDGREGEGTADDGE